MFPSLWPPILGAALARQAANAALAAAIRNIPPDSPEFRVELLILKMHSHHLHMHSLN